MTKKNSKTNTVSPAVVALALVCLTITLCGCNTYNTTAAHANAPESFDYGVPNADLIFHRPVVQYLNDRYQPAQPYVKPDWPVARAPQGYVNAADEITYAEDYYSDQYIRGDNEPRIRFHRRIRGTRYRQMTR